MHIKLQRTLATSAAKAWIWLTEPDFMNQWSDAAITQTAIGADDSASSVGTARTVKLGPVLLRETIIQSEPPHFLMYRVAAQYPLRKHTGRITLTPLGDGVSLDWEVDADFVRGGTLAQILLERALGRSLDKLVSLASGDARLPAAPLPQAPLNDDVDALWVDAMGVLDEQRQLAHRLAAQESPLQWFARAYAHVTDLQMREVKSAGFAHPGWVLHLIPRFHEYYVNNLRAFTLERREPVEAHWQRAFVRMHQRKGRPLDRAFAAIAAGAAAHIDEDLPRAIASVQHMHYRAHRLGRFRGDYMTMGPIFGEAGSRVMAELPREWFAPRDRFLASSLSQELREQVQARIFFDIARARARAFERAERLTLLLGAHDQVRHEPRELGRVS